MELDWLAESGLAALPEFLTALAIGLLMGLERERNPTAKAGLRTFALVSLSGAAAEFLGEALAALIVCYLLGALAVAGHARLAVTLSILATVLLYFKVELSGVVRGLERRDLISISCNSRW